MAKIKDRRSRLIIWALCVLGVSALPILFRTLTLAADNKLQDGWDILATGDLILIAGVICVGALGDLARTRKSSFTDAELGILGSTCLLLFASGWLYAFVTAESASDDKRLTGWCSLIVFGISVLICLCTIVIGEQQSPAADEEA